MNVPEQALEYTSEKELLEIFYYEAKYRGGIAVATIEALTETLENSLTKFNKLGIQVNLNAISGNDQILRQKIEAICKATTLIQA